MKRKRANARKDHICTVCGQPIPAGYTYHKLSSVKKCHVGCVPQGEVDTAQRLAERLVRAAMKTAQKGTILEVTGYHVAVRGLLYFISIIRQEDI